MDIHTSLWGTPLEKVVHDAVLANQPVGDAGVAVAVLNGGKLSFAGGFGLRDRASGQPVNAQTLFGIGSATKAFTSMLLSIQASKRVISLDDPISSYAPDFKMQESRVSTTMNLVDILTHRTGLPRHDALWYLGPFTRSQLFYRLPYLEQIAGAFRTTFLYNNLMYTAAGHLLERQSGTTWEESVKQYILDPLGMADTSFTLADLLGAANHAKGYKMLVDVPPKDFENIGPAGEINSNVLDLAKWVQLFLAKGVTSNGTRLIDQSALERMYTGLTSIGGGSTTRYGLGWYVGQLDGQSYVFHDGVADGYTAYVSFMPGKMMGVVVLTNQHGSGTIKTMWPRKVAEPIYDYLLNGSVTGTVSLPDFPQVESSSFERAGLPGSVPATGMGSDYTGMYCNDGYGDMAVGEWGGGLSISYYGRTWQLIQTAPDNFAFMVHAFATDFPVLTRFNRDSSAKVVSASLLLERMLPNRITFTRR